MDVKRCSFRLEVSLRSHLFRTHKVFRGVKTDSLCYTSRTVNTKFICSLSLCMKEFDSSRAIIKHLKCHIRQKEKIKCPFRDCKKEYDKVHSFTGHLSKKHRISAGNTSCLTLINTCSISDCENLTLNENCIDEQSKLLVNSISDVYDDTQQIRNSTDLFLLNVAQLFLKLECQLLVPMSSLQTIVSGTLNTYEQSQEIVKSNLKTRLREECILADQIDLIVNQVFSDDPFLVSTKTLNTDYKRKKFYKDHCAFVEPVEVVLSTDHEQKKFFHYVPIQKTLKELFSDKSLSNELRYNCEIRERDVQTDFTDGSVFKDSVFFFNKIQMP